jgi:hypothetical protein
VIEGIRIGDDRWRQRVEECLELGGLRCLVQESALVPASSFVGTLPGTIVCHIVPFVARPRILTVGLTII